MCDNRDRKENRKKKKIIKTVGKTLLILTVATAGAGLFLWITMDRTGKPTNIAVVDTTYGRIRGTIDDGVYTYHGIEYAI